MQLHRPSGAMFVSEHNVIGDEFSVSGPLSGCRLGKTLAE
jgi:hypothetical protein